MIDNEALASIEKLHKMKAEGVISEEEFIQAKQQLLEGRRARPQQTRSIDQTGSDPDVTDHVGWMLLPLKRYAQFEGRSCRREFWMFALFVNLIGGALALVVATDTGIFGESGPFGTAAMFLLLIGLLGVAVPYLAVQVRRFHDQGKSGWFALLNLIPYVGAFIVLAFMLVPGVPEENEYGPDPLT